MTGAVRAIRLCGGTTRAGRFLMENERHPVSGEVMRASGEVMRARGISEDLNHFLREIRTRSRSGNTTRTPSDSRPRVIIVGAGFGGLSAAKALAELPVSVTVVDGHNYHLFQPLLYQIATGSLSPADITSP